MGQSYSFSYEKIHKTEEFKGNHTNIVALKNNNYLYHYLTNRTYSHNEMKEEIDLMEGSKKSDPEEYGREHLDTAIKEFGNLYKDMDPNDLINMKMNEGRIQPWQYATGDTAFGISLGTLLRSIR